MWQIIEITIRNLGVNMYSVTTILYFYRIIFHSRINIVAFSQNISKPFHSIHTTIFLFLLEKILDQVVQSSDNRELYQRCVRDVIDSAMEGFNATVKF